MVRLLLVRMFVLNKSWSGCQAMAVGGVTSKNDRRTSATFCFGIRSSRRIFFCFLRFAAVRAPESLASMFFLFFGVLTLPCVISIHAKSERLKSKLLVLF